MRRKNISPTALILIFTLLNIAIAVGLGFWAIGKDAEHYAAFKKIPFPENGFECIEEAPWNGAIRVSGSREEFLRDSIMYLYDIDGIVEYDVTLYYEKHTAPKDIAQDAAEVMRGIEHVDEQLIIRLIEGAEGSTNVVGEKVTLESGALITAKYAAANGLERDERCIRIEMKYTR